MNGKLRKALLRVVALTGGSSLHRNLTSELEAKFGIDRAPKFPASGNFLPEEK